jgi:hypothetical protein
MTSEAIQREPSYLEDIPILSTSMTTTDTCFEPIRDLDDPPYTLPQS